jgi:predicted enzyme related to lactoylglutathione lyase
VPGLRDSSRGRQTHFGKRREGTMADLLVNIDVPDLERAIAFYSGAFGLSVRRRFGADGAELAGWPVAVFLLHKEQGSFGADHSRRVYERHWTPVHLDVVVADIDAALTRARDAGAVVEQAVRTAKWGKLALLADPFGHGFCLVEFRGGGYDEIAGG